MAEVTLEEAISVAVSKIEDSSFFTLITVSLF